MKRYPVCSSPASGCKRQFANKNVVKIKPAFCVVRAARSNSMFGPTNRKIRNMQSRKNKKAGFTLVEIMIVVAIIGLLAAIAIPNFVRARTTAQANACINNLRQIDSAKQQWALEMRVGTNATPVVTDIDPYLGRSGNSSNVTCPAGGQTATFLNSYTINPESQPPACEIGAGFAPPH